MSDFPLPAQWQENLETHWQQYQEKLSALSDEASLLDSDEWQPSLRRVWGCSDFCLQAALRYPAMMEALVASGDLSCRIVIRSTTVRALKTTSPFESVVVLV